jgi:hypothetical protein
LETAGWEWYLARLQALRTPESGPGVKRRARPLGKDAPAVSSELDYGCGQAEPAGLVLRKPPPPVATVLAADAVVLPELLLRLST